MGCHILKGQLDGDDPNICGFCGRNVCQNKLQTSSVTHGKKSYKIESNCIYLHSKARAPAKSSVRQPCTNWLVKCAVKRCSADIWTYMGKRHFKSVHADEPCPVFITQEEILKMKK